MTKRMTLRERARLGAGRLMRDAYNTGLLWKDKSAIDVGYFHGWIAGYRAAKREGKRK